MHVTCIPIKKLIVLKIRYIVLLNFGFANFSEIVRIEPLTSV